MTTAPSAPPPAAAHHQEHQHHAEPVIKQPLQETVVVPVVQEPVKVHHTVTMPAETFSAPTSTSARRCAPSRSAST